MNKREIMESNFNDYFRTLKIYCKITENEKFVLSNKLLKISKKDFIIFEADIKNIDFSYLDNQKRRKMIIPTNKIFIEIPKWFYQDDNNLVINNGGICLLDNSEELLLENQNKRKMIIAHTMWTIINKNNGKISLKPLSISFFDDIFIKHHDDEKIESYKIGSMWSDEHNIIKEIPLEKIKKEIIKYVKNIIFYLLIKIEKKEYTSYKKFHPLGFENKEIVYSYEVSKHKRHFWKDSGRFKIPYLSKEELIERGYKIDEIVFRDGELRRDVPYRIVGNFIIGKQKKKKEENKRLNLAKSRILRNEEKLYRLIKEIFPEDYIKKHDRKVLHGLELDILVYNKRIAFEYDGEQHFNRELCENVFKSDFKELKKRDKKKDKLCKKKNMVLIRVKYNEPLTKNHIKKKLKLAGIKR
jgi:hypothetical protein